VIEIKPESLVHSSIEQYVPSERLAGDKFTFASIASVRQEMISARLSSRSGIDEMALISVFGLEVNSQEDLGQ